MKKSPVWSFKNKTSNNITDAVTIEKKKIAMGKNFYLDVDY